MLFLLQNIASIFHVLDDIKAGHLYCVGISTEDCDLVLNGFFYLLWRPCHCLALKC